MKSYKASSKSLFDCFKSASIWLNCGQCSLSTPLILISTHSRKPDFLGPRFYPKHDDFHFGQWQDVRISQNGPRNRIQRKNFPPKDLKAGRPKDWPPIFRARGSLYDEKTPKNWRKTNIANTRGRILRTSGGTTSSIHPAIGGWVH